MQTTGGRVPHLTKRTVLAVLAGTLTVAAGGCAEVEKTLNRGGDTTCGDYLQMDEHNKRVTVTKFVQQRAGNNEDPAGTTVDLTMAAVGGLCNLPNQASVPIKNASNLGINLGPHPT